MISFREFEPAVEIYHISKYREFPNKKHKQYLSVLHNYVGGGLTNPSQKKYICQIGSFPQVAVKIFTKIFELPPVMSIAPCWCRDS